MVLVFSPQAARDIEEIGDSIASDNPLRAVSFIASMRERCARIETMPRAAPLRPELGEGIRLVVFGNYLIFYAISEKDIRIERILHGARNLPELFGE